MPPRSAKMKRRIFGFQRRVWWPKWTPASSRSRMEATAIVIAPCGFALRCTGGDRDAPAPEAGTRASSGAAGEGNREPERLAGDRERRDGARPEADGGVLVDRHVPRRLDEERAAPRHAVGIAGDGEVVRTGLCVEGEEPARIDGRVLPAHRRRDGERTREVIHEDELLRR